jgi:hypothetical protein
VFGFDSDRMDWNFANLQATVYNTSAKQAKTAKDFLLQFDSEREKQGDELFAHLKLFAIKHNASIKDK